MSKRKSIARSTDESTVAVQDSPVSSIKQKGNLTGNIRVVRDHVFDIYSLVQQWNSELLDGMTIISEIRNEIIKKRYSDKSEIRLCSENLQQLSRNLEEICEKMELIVEKFGQKSASIQALSRLNAKNEQRKPMFLTWSTSKFVETCQQMYEMFRKEVELKTGIKEELFFCSNKDTLVFYEAAWLHQPYIEKFVNLNFEAMLKEVGHTSLNL